MNFVKIKVSKMWILWKKETFLLHIRQFSKDFQPLWAQLLKSWWWNLSQKVEFSQQHPVFPGGHPSKYWLDSTLLNFSDRTRTGVFNVIWPLAFERAKSSLFQSRVVLENGKEKFGICLGYFHSSSRYCMVRALVRQTP